MRWWRRRPPWMCHPLLCMSHESARRDTENIVTEFNPMLYILVLWELSSVGGASRAAFSFSAIFRFFFRRSSAVCWICFAGDGRRSCIRFLFNKCRKVFTALTLPSPQLFGEESHTRTFIVLFVRCIRYAVAAAAAFDAVSVPVSGVESMKDHFDVFAKCKLWKTLTLTTASACFPSLPPTRYPALAPLRSSSVRLCVQTISLMPTQIEVYHLYAVNAERQVVLWARRGTMSS